MRVYFKGTLQSLESSFNYVGEKLNVVYCYTTFNVSRATKKATEEDECGTYWLVYVVQMRARAAYNQHESCSLLPIWDQLSHQCVCSLFC